jgi:hypothetical protein
MVCAGLLLSKPALAQSAGAEEQPLCLGFTFGLWTPALDWKRAGHQALLDSARTARTAEGRSWASGAAASDSGFVLYPAWWPAGVLVEVSRERLAAGDTVSGVATAFNADVRLRASTSRVRAWRVRCRR